MPKKKLIKSYEDNVMKLFRLLVPCILLMAMVACDAVYRCEYFAAALPKDIVLKEYADLENSDHLSYVQTGENNEEHYVIILYPCVIDPNKVIEYHTRNNNLLHIQRTESFKFSTNHGVRKLYSDGLLQMGAYCFNQHGWTILVQAFDKFEIDRKLRKTVYSFKVLTPLD